MGLIRILLAISVIIAHSAPVFGMSLVGGSTAVETFFIISGFYMALILNEKYVGENYSYKMFMKSRLMRLMPIYWVVLIIAMMVHNFGFVNKIVSLFQNYDITTGLFMVFNNLFILGQDVVMFLTVNANTGLLEFVSNFRDGSVMLHQFLAIPAAWSLSLEIMFYMMAPFICRLKTRYIAMIFAASALIKILLKVSGFNFDPWSYRFFPAELCLFVAGVLAYKIYQHIKNKGISKNTCKIFYVVFLASLFSYNFFYEVFPLFKYLYFSFAAVAIPYIFSLTKNYKFDNFIANLSYPIYIVHLFILQNIPVHQGVNLVFIVLISTVLYLFVDKPINEYRQTFIKKNVSQSDLAIVDEEEVLTNAYGKV